MIFNTARGILHIKEIRKPYKVNIRPQIVHSDLCSLCITSSVFPSLSTLSFWLTVVLCYVKTRYLLTGFGLGNTRKRLAEHSKFDRFHGRKLRLLCNCPFTYLLTFSTLIQCCLQCINTVVILIILYMIVSDCYVSVMKLF